MYIYIYTIDTYNVSREIGRSKDPHDCSELRIDTRKKALLTWLQQMYAYSLCDDWVIFGPRGDGRDVGRVAVCLASSPVFRKCLCVLPWTAHHHHHHHYYYVSREIG